MIINIESLESFSTPFLIRNVQEMHVKYEQAVKEKKERTKKVKDAKEMLQSLRFILQGRLKQMNRYDPKFFPIGSYVEYNNTVNEKIGPIKKLGKVVDHHGSFVQVQFEGEIYQVKVDPANLTLLFIRNKYY